MAEPRDNKSSARRVGVREFRSNLTSILRQVEEGHRFLLTSNHKVVAEIGPPSTDSAARTPGALRGKIKLAEDFDALPADALTAMEGGA